MADTQFIVDEIRKGRPLLLGMGVVLVVIAGGASFIPVEAGAEAYVPFIKWGILAVFVALGGFLFWMGLQPPEKHPLIRALHETPDRIVWAHVLERRTNGVHSATLLIVRTDAGKTLEAPIPMNAEGERRAMALIEAIAPRATKGYRPEYELMFRSDPKSLRRA
ncbi:MAG: hypothetical protein U0441_15665 [Polyangiaceae bacterium]